MKRELLFVMSLIFIVMISINETYGVSAYPKPVSYKLPDGSTLTIFIRGDEKAKWGETLDGYSILVSGSGFYEYAIQNKQGDLVPSGIRVSDVQKRTLKEKAFLSGISKGLNYSSMQLEMSKQIWQMNSFYSSSSFPTTGNRKLLVILIGYTDLSITKTKEMFVNLCNQVGYNLNGATGSVKDYYSEASYGQLNLTIDVAGPYVASHDMAYYGANINNEAGKDIRARDLVTEAVNLADPDVNYADYDNDGDGNVDGVHVIYAGYGEEAGGGANAIWAHAWSITPVTHDGKTISKYSCSPELRGNSGSIITAIGVICHEFGHVLGAYDFYDTNYDTDGLFIGTGNWDIMASGSWNNDGMTPAHHNPYTKVYCYNWSTATLLSSSSTITVNNATENNNAFYRYNTSTTNEFFLIENREKIKFDAYLPGSGMIIYHVHSGISSSGPANIVNTTHPQQMYPVCASATTDPTSTPSSYGVINSAGTPFPGSSNKTLFTDFSTPSSKSWAGVNTSKSVSNISRNATAKTVTFDFMGGVQVALVLDRSGSMGSSYYLEPAKSAAKDFVNLMNLNDWLAVTSFDQSSYLNFPFTQITSDQIKTNAKNAIANITVGGSTSIGAGMQIAQAQLNLGNTAKAQGMILLSDGYENTSPYVYQVQPTIPGNTDIYTIALGPDSDQGLLNSIAASTGGFYSYSPNTQRLSLIYSTIRAKVTGQQTLALVNGIIAQGQNIIQNILIDAGATFANFSVTWPGSDLDMVLTDPLGTVIDHNVTDPNISFTSGDTYETYSIMNPVPGQYAVKITGVSVSGQEPYSATVTGESSLTMEVTLNKSFYGTNEPILIRAQLKDGTLPLLGATVSANVTTPVTPVYAPASQFSSGEPGAGKLLTYEEVDENHGRYVDDSSKVFYNYYSNLSSLTLYDDGLHGDVSANDGIYGNYYTATSSSGSYSFDVSASGTAPVSGSFTRTDSKSTIVTTTQSILVTEPQTGVTWYAQSNNTVYWSSSNITGNVNIYLSTDGGSTFPTQLAMNTPDDGSEEITVPLVQSGTCRIKVQSVNYPSIYGLNPGNFSIVPCVPPVPSFTESPGASSCTGTDITYTTQPGQTNYVWAILGVLNTDFTITAGNIGSTSNSVTIQWLTTGSKIVIVNYTTPGGCAGLTPASSATTVNARPVPTFTALPGAVSCDSTNISYTTQSGQSNYEWIIPGILNTDYSITSGGTGSGSNTVTLKWLTTGSKTVTVNYTNSFGCSGLAPAISTTLVNSLPDQPSVITGNTNPCWNSSQTYSVTNVPGVSYAWTFPSGWVKTAGGTSNSVTVTVGTGTGNIEVVPSTACGNGLSRVLPVSPLTIPAQPGPISGGTNPCQGYSYTYSVTSVPGVNYTWSFPSGWVQTGGGTTNSVIVTVGAGSGNVQVTPSNVCGIGPARLLSVTPSTVPAAAGVITGSISPCLNSSQVYSVPGISGVSYAWTFPAGWVQTAGGTTNSVTVTVGSGAGNIQATPYNICGSGTPRILAVTVSAVPVQPGAITGSTSPCTGSSQGYNVPNVAGTAYTWAFPTGWVQTGGGTTNSVTVTVGTGSGNIIVTPLNVCGSGTPQTQPVTPVSIPLNPGTISVSGPLCIGTSVTFSVINVPGVTYTWSFPSGWGVPNGVTINSITVTVGSNPGNIIITPSNACGMGPTTLLAVLPFTLPAQPSSISGSTNPCLSYSQNYSVTSVAGVSYTWSFPTGWTQIAGGTTNSVTVTVGAGSGNIQVTPSNACGSGPAQTLGVYSVTLPLKPSVITGDPAALPGSSQQYSVVNVPGVTYAWVFPTGSIQTGGGTSNSVTITVGSGPFTIQVTPLNSCGTGPPQTYVVPSQLSLDNTTITSGQSFCYNAVQHLTVAGSGKTFVVQSGGSATMVAGTMISYMAGSKVFSGGYIHGYITTSGVYCNIGTKISSPVAENTVNPLINPEPGNSKNNNTSFKIYPNPTTGSFIFELTGEARTSAVQVEIFGIRGEKVVVKELVNERKREFSLSNYPSGLYLIRVNDGSTVETAKIIKQ